MYRTKTIRSHYRRFREVARAIRRSRITVLAGLITLLFAGMLLAGSPSPSNTFAQAELETTPSSQFGGRYRGIVRIDDTLFISQGARIAYFDGRDDSEMTPLGESEWFDGEIRALVRGPDLGPDAIPSLVAAGYHAGAGRLWVIAIEDRLQTRIVAHADFPEPADFLDFAVDLALAGKKGSRSEHGAVFSVDLHSLLAMARVPTARIELPLSAAMTMPAEIRSLALYRKTALVIHSEGLEQLDYSDPVMPKLVNRIVDKAAVDIDIRDDADPPLVALSFEAEVQLYELRNGRDLFHISTTNSGTWAPSRPGPPPAPISSSCWIGNHLLVVRGYSGPTADDVIVELPSVHLIDYNSPHSPEHVANTRYSDAIDRSGSRNVSAPKAIFVHGPWVFRTSFKGTLARYPANEQLQLELLKPSSAETLATYGPVDMLARSKSNLNSDRIGFTARSAFGVVEIREDGAFLPRGTILAGESARRVYASDDCIFGINRGFNSSALHVLVPCEGPSPRDSWQRGYLDDLAVHGDLALILRSSTLQILNWGSSIDGLPLVEIEIDRNFGSPEAISAVHSHTAILGTNDEGLIVLDVSQPSDPQVLSSIPAGQWSRSGSLQDMVAYGHRAYALLRSALIVFDLQDPRESEKIHKIELPEEAHQLALDASAGRLFIATDNGVLEMQVDMTLGDSEEPRLIRRWAQSLPVQGVAIGKGRLLAGAGASGLLVYDHPEIGQTLDQRPARLWLPFIGKR